MSESLPLEGVKILDLSRLLPGPFCSLLLADLGAEVLKVEDTGLGDYVRWAPPYVGDEDDQKRGVGSAQFNALNRNKRSIRLDLKQEDAREVLLKLAAEYDVLLESFRPGVLDRLGVGYETLKEQNEALVYCAITGYGQDGPQRDRAGHDINYLALNGLLALTGPAGGGPAQLGAQIADIGGGAQNAAIAILAALLKRESTGKGSFIDISMTDGAMSWLAMPAARALEGEELRRGKLELAGGFICYLPYEAADGWVAVGALEPKFWKSFCEGSGRPDLIEKQYEAPGSDAWRAVAEIIKSQSREHWAAFGAEHDCCIDPVLEIEEALASDLAQKREMVIDVGTSRQVASPFKFDGERPGRRDPAPAFGEHTGKVLSELGYSDDEIDALQVAGAIA